MPPRAMRSGAVALIAALALSVTMPMAASADDRSGASWNDEESAPSQTGRPSSTPRLEAVPGTTLGDSRRASKAPASVTAAPGQVTGVTAKLDTSTSVILSWTAPSGGESATGYVLEMSDGVVTYELDWPYAETSVRIYDLPPDTPYTVRVAAVNASGTGDYSELVSFTTPFIYVERQAGANRFATAARVAQRTFPHSGIGGAFLVNGLDFPDALAAAAAAGSAGGPVLLTRPTSLVPEAREQLEWLQPETLVVAGGSGAVSGAVMSAADEYATGGTYRLAGKNRYGTAAEVSRMWSTASTVYLASGLNFPDALAGAAAAGVKDSPVLLTAATKLPAETAAALRRLKPSRIVVLGGSGAVSASVASAAKAATGVSTTVKRLSGANRYATAISISKATFPTAGVPVAFVASGTGFPDALAGAAAAGYLGGPVLLTETGAASPELIAEIKRLKPRRIVVLGGTAAVSSKVVSQLNATKP